MGGQVAAGESIAATLARETMEEAGLALADLRDLERCPPITIRRPVAEGYMVERIEVFRARRSRRRRAEQSRRRGRALRSPRPRRAASRASPPAPSRSRRR